MFASSKVSCSDIDFFVYIPGRVDFFDCNRIANSLSVDKQLDFRSLRSRRHIRANVATASETSKIQLLVDGKVLLDTVTIDKVDTTWNVYKEIDIGAANLTAGEHVLKLVIAGSYVNVDWLQFCEGETCEAPTGIREIMSATVTKTSAPRLRKQGGKLFVEKNGVRFDLTGHRIK